MSIRFFAQDLKESHTAGMSVPKQQNSYPLRMPEQLRARLDEYAKANGRKLNAEIVARLQESIEPVSFSLAWPELVKLLQSEAEKQGAKITITIG